MPVIYAIIFMLGFIIFILWRKRNTNNKKKGIENAKL